MTFALEIARWAWGLLWLAVTAHAMWPWLPHFSDNVYLRWPLTVALSLGGLTLWLLVCSIWMLNVWAALAYPVLVLGSGLLYRRARPHTTPPPPPIPFDGLILAMLAAVALAYLFVLGQATYYPFIADDEISRYAYYARLLVEQGRLTPAVRGYPMFLPYAYASIFLVTGIRPEQLARLIPVLLSVATLLAAAALAYRWASAANVRQPHRAAWATILVLALTPNWLEWSPHGYIDIPTALYVTLAALAADVWRTQRDFRWALLAGALAGLAFWVKQAGLFALGPLGLVYAGVILPTLVTHHRLDITAIRDGLLTLAVALIIGGTWYLRNVAYDGWAGAIPGPGAFYTALAQRRLDQLIPFISEFTALGWVAAPLYLLGLAAALLQLRQPGRLWALLWAVPYTLLWWYSFSYDVRFLLTVLPFYAVLVGLAAADLSDWLTARITAPPRWLPYLVAVLLLAASLHAATTARLGGLRQWAVAPTASYAERLYRAKADLYPVVEWIEANVPPDAPIISMDGRLSYYLIDRPIRVVYPATLESLYNYDYIVVGSWWTTVYPGFGLADSTMAAELAQPTILRQRFSGPTGSIVIYEITP